MRPRLRAALHHYVQRVLESQHPLFHRYLEAGKLDEARARDPRVAHLNVLGYISVRPEHH
jgi:hypothetical protein